MKKLSILFILTLTFLPMFVYGQSQPVSYFGAIPDLKVNGKEFVDPTGKAVTLHGVMDTPNAYFNGNRWCNGIAWPYYNQAGAVEAVKKYFTKVFQAIANPAKGTYCNLFRLHLDPCWATCDANVKATGFTEKDNKVYDPHGNEVSGEANIYHFDMTRFKARMTDLYVPIIQDALAHGLYVVVRPPGVFPHDIWVGDYYNTFLTNIWDEISKNDYIRSHSGQIMLELGNEPVRIWKNGEIIPTVPAANKTLESTRSDAYNGYSENNPVLADFFQPIVNKIRSNGFNGIILLPGTSYQANYNSYKNKAISDSKNNYGYAVHNYPGWYGGWDKNQTEAQFITTFESQVPIDQKPIVITEVDWSPEWRLSDKSHWNEEHTQFTAGNYGTWATGTTNGVTQGVDLVASQNIGWGLKYRHLVDKHPNISFTLQGTTTYVDMDAYLKDATVQPAFLTQMMKDGYPDARQACSGYCFDWYKDFACGDRIPYGTPNVAPEVITYHTTATTIGNAYFDDTNAHYCFYTQNNSAFIFKEYVGTPLIKCAEFTLNLGEGSAIGYRLDVQLKDKDGNIIKDGTNDYIIGTEAKGTRNTNPTAASKTYDFQTIFAEYIEKYPGCTVGEIRLNTVVEGGKEDNTERTGKYWFTIDKMDMNVSEVTARTGSKGTSLEDIKMYRHEGVKNFVINDDAETAKMGGWGGTITRTAGVGKDGSYCYVLTNEKTNTWESQVNYEGTYPNGTEYTLSMDIKGASSGSLPVNIQKAAGNVVCWQGTINYTTEWQTVSVPVTINGEGADRLLFDYGGKSTLYIDNVQLYTGTEKVTEITGKNIRLGENATNGAEVFGAGLGGSVSYKDYADLSDFSKMIIKGTGGSLRVLYNRPVNDGTCPELSVPLTSDEAVVDLSTYPYFHLNSIKAGWEQTVNVSSITLIDGSGNNVEIADYYITGAGHKDESVLAASADEQATVIDLTGYTGMLEYAFASANPNCLLIYTDKQNVGNRFDGRNLVQKVGDNYNTWMTNLVDGHDFRAPFAIRTVGGATYTRDLGTTKTWGTTVIPFALDVTAEGSPRIYVLNSQEGDILRFTKVTKVTEGTIPAGSIILYYQENGGIVKLLGNNIAQTVEGFNIHPVAGVNGWYTAQSYKSQVIEDVTTDPYLKDYDVYAVSNNKFVHATKKLTLNPFRALYLHKKTVGGAPKASFNICLEDVATGIQENLNLSETREVEVYDVMGRRVSTPVKGITIIRMPNGTVRKVLNE